MHVTKPSSSLHVRRNLTRHELRLDFLGDTLRLLGAIEIHRNRAVYVSLNTNANPTPNPRPRITFSYIMARYKFYIVLYCIVTLILTLALTVSERNAILWRQVNYNLALFGFK